MERFASGIIKHRLFVLVVVGLLTGWFGYHAAQIRMDTDVLNFLPDQDEDVRFFKETGQRFGTNHINMVALETEDIFTFEGLSALRALTDSIAGVNGVNQVLSLTNLLDMRQDPQGGISVQYLVDEAEVPRDPELLSDLRRRVLADTMLVGNLVSEDGRAALISVMVDEQADKERVARDVKSAAQRAAPGQKVYFGGFAMIMEYMSGLIAGDMSKLVPVTVVVVLLMLYLGLGSLRGVVLPMATVILATVWTLGTMRLFGMALSMLTSVIPVVIIAIGTASGIYIMSRYVERGGPGGTGQEHVRHALAREAGAVAFAGVTLVVGFLCLLTAPLSVFREFGIAAAMGAFWSMVLSLTLLPAWLSYLPLADPRRFAIASPENRPVTRVLGGIGRWVARRRRAVVLAVALLLAGAAALVPGLPRNVDLMAYFPAGSEPQVSELLLQRYFGGSQLFMVNFRARDVRHPAILEEMDLLEKRLRVVPDVNLPQSVAGVFKMLNRNLNREPGLPDSLDKVNNLWFMLDGQPSIALLLQSSFANGVVQARIGDIDSAVVSQAIARVRTVLSETVSSHLVAVPWQEQPAPLRDAFAAELAARMALKAALDVEFHTGRKIASEDLIPLLLPLLAGAPDLDAAQRERFRARVAAYFREGDSLLRLDPGMDFGALAERVAGLEDLSREAIADTLRGALPAAAWQSDPEGLDLDAGSLRAVARAFIARGLHETALSRVVSALGIQPGDPQHARLLEDLEADLWAVNSSFLAVRPDVYRTITGHAPDPGEVIRVETRLTGWPPVSAKFDAQLPGALAKAISMAFLVIVVLLVLRLRSLHAGMATASPMLLTIVLVLGAMSLLGIPLDNTTLMISSIALGVSVMYAIHFTDRFRAELARGVPAERAVEATAIHKGRAIVVNTLTVALGFGVLGFSVMAPQRQFGLFIGLTMFLATLGTFTLLPAILLMGRHPARQDRA